MLLIRGHIGDPAQSCFDQVPITRSNGSAVSDVGDGMRLDL